jgi:hypothetical protein
MSETHEQDCKNFAWAVRHGYIQRSNIDGSWCVRAVGSENTLLLAVYNCPYCGKPLGGHEPEPTERKRIERLL